MKHYITPEQFNANEDAPSAIIDFPMKFIRMPYSAEAGGRAVVKVPNEWCGKIQAAVHFVCNGNIDAGATISIDGYPLTPTNNASGSVSADVSGSAGSIVRSTIADLDCSNLSGHTFVVKVAPNLSTSTVDEPVDIALVELSLGTY